MSSEGSLRDYCCLLDMQPDYLVPPLLYRTQLPGALVVNPRAWFSWNGGAPRDFSSQVRAHAAALGGRCIVWVADSATGTVWPYGVGEEYLPHLARLSPGQAMTAGLPAAVAWVLMQADILVRPDHAQRRHWDWWHRVRRSGGEIGRGYTCVGGLIPPLQLGAMRRYYRRKVRTGAMRLGDDQVPRRYAAHNEPLARFVLSQLTPAVAQLVRRQVKPTYAYVAAYQSGSVLERHTDRAQCEYTISLCVDATPEPGGACPWPINLETADGRIRVFQRLGEALLFQGRRIAHSRDRLAAGCSSTSLLLHYVDGEFQGELD